MIRYGHGIKIEGWGNKGYEKQVKKLLDDFIAHNDVGRIILSNIDVCSHYLTIIPYSDADLRDRGECHAYTQAADNDDASPADVDYYVINTKGDYVRSGSKGTGKGAEVRLHFTPGMFGKGKCYGGLYGSMPDEVLFHEMIHGLRDLQGLDDQIPVGGGYADQEEFLAIVITNIYMSAKTKSTTGLRADYSDPLSELKPPLNSSAGFLKDTDNLKLLEYLDRDETLLFFGLGMIPETVAPFNPIRELQNNLTDYRWGLMGKMPQRR